MTKDNAWENTLDTLCLTRLDPVTVSAEEYLGLLEKLISQSIQAERRRISEAVKTIRPIAREINHHSSYNEGRTDFSEAVLSIINPKE